METWDGRGQHPDVPALNTLDTIRTDGIWDFIGADGAHLGYAEVNADGRAFIFSAAGLMQPKSTTALAVELLAKSRGVKLVLRDKITMSKQDLKDMVGLWESNPDGEDTCDLLRTVCDALPGQPDGEFSADEIRAMIDTSAALDGEIYVGCEGGFVSRGRLADGVVELFEGHAPHGHTQDIAADILAGERSGNFGEYHWRLED